MAKAISTAIEKGGYQLTPKAWGAVNIISMGAKRMTVGNPHRRATTFYLSEIVLDPEFWKSLGKALGWGETEYIKPDGSMVLAAYWEYVAHQYFDLVLTGGDTESFWKELLK